MRYEIKDIKPRPQVSFICVNNTPRIFKDGSTDRAGEFLTVGKSYIGFYNDDRDSIFLEETDLGGFPQGHQWFNSKRFKLLSEVREDKPKELGI